MDAVMMQLRRFLSDRLILSEYIDAERLVDFLRSIAGSTPIKPVLDAAKSQGWIRGPWYDANPYLVEDLELTGNDWELWKLPKRYQILHGVSDDRQDDTLGRTPRQSPVSRAEGKRGGRPPDSDEKLLEQLEDFERSGLSQEEYRDRMEGRYGKGWSKGAFSTRMAKARDIRSLQVSENRSENRSENPETENQ